MGLVVQQFTLAFRAQLPNASRIRGQLLQFTTSEDTNRRPRKTLGTKLRAIQACPLQNGSKNYGDVELGKDWFTLTL